jgi:hypothetical protein
MNKRCKYVLKEIHITNNLSAQAFHQAQGSFSFDHYDTSMYA